MNPHPFHTGYIPCESTPKGCKLLYPTSSPIPSSSVTDVSPIPIFNQQYQPSCVAHAIVTYVMWLHYKKTGKIKLLSPRFLYAITIREMGTDPHDGSSLKVALQMAKKYGICEDVYFPNTTDISIPEYADATKIPQVAYDSALDYRIGDFYFLTSLTQQSIRQAIHEWGLILYGIRISDKWWKPSYSAGDLLPIRPPNGFSDPTISGHLVTGFGYDDTPQDYFRNEWSANWAAAGNGYFASNELPYVYEGAIIEGLRPDNATEYSTMLQRVIDWLKNIFS